METNGTLVIGTGVVVAQGQAVVDGTLQVTACGSGQLGVLQANGGVVTGSNLHITAIPCAGCQAASVTGTQIASTTISATVSVTGCRSGEGETLPVGAIVGIAIGAVLIGVLIVFFVVFLTKRQRQQHQEEAVEAINLDQQQKMYDKY